MLKWFPNKSYDSKYRIGVLKYYHTHTHTISSDMLVETTSNHYFNVYNVYCDPIYEAYLTHVHITGT